MFGLESGTLLFERREVLDQANGDERLRFGDGTVDLGDHEGGEMLTGGRGDGTARRERSGGRRSRVGKWRRRGVGGRGGGLRSSRSSRKQRRSRE
jgi:hypothetical protein